MDYINHGYSTNKGKSISGKGKNKGKTQFWKKYQCGNRNNLSEKAGIKKQKP